MFIYDMAGSQYTNFELDLSKKILNLLKVAAAGMQRWDGAEWDEMGWDGGDAGGWVPSTAPAPRGGAGTGRGSAVPTRWIPRTAAGSAFMKTDANYFLMVLAFRASSLLRKKSSQ